MMEMIANYGNPISPQPPPLPRSFEEPIPADLRGPSFQEYLKTPVEAESSHNSPDKKSLEQPSREPSVSTDKADLDKPTAMQGEGGPKESKNAAVREAVRSEESEDRETGQGKAEKQARGTGKKIGPETLEGFLKKGGLPDEADAEKTLGGLKKTPKEDAAVSGEEAFSLTAMGRMQEELGETEAESLLVSLSGPASGAEKSLDELLARRETRKDNGMEDGKVKPSGAGGIKTAGTSSSEVTRLKVVSAENPDQGIEITLTDARSRGKLSGHDAAESRRGAAEAVKKDEASLNRPEGLQAPEGEKGNIRVMELGGDSQERSGTPSAFSAKETKSAAASFGEILREKGIGQVVRQTGILLKDDNRGEIKLILKPEALGKVRIQLNLEDNRIAGRILVENSSVRDAFNQNIEELQRALRESGFESAHLEVSVEGEASGQNQDGRRDPLRNQRMIAHAIEEGLPGMITLQREESLVNLMA